MPGSSAELEEERGRNEVSQLHAQVQGDLAEQRAERLAVSGYAWDPSCLAM